jgi:PAS domain S-box-containing protein
MKIRTKVQGVFFCITLTLLLLTNGLFYFSAKRNLTQQILNHLESVAAIQYNRIRGINAQNLERWGLVASRTQLRISLADFITDGDPTHQARMNRILHDAKAPVSDFRSMSICALDGTIVASTDDEKIGENHAADVFFVRGRKRVNGDLFFRDSDGRLMISLAGPLYQQEKLLGVLVIESLVDNMITSIGDYTGLGQTGETILAMRDKNGDALFLMPTRFDPQAALKLIVAKDKTDRPITRLFEGIQELTAEAVDYRGVPVLAATRHVEETDWGIVVKIDRAEAFAPVAQMRNMLIFVVVASLLLVILVSLYFARSITRPIIRLTEVARNISNGKISGRADESLQDETGVLAQAFNSMTDILITTHKNLESQVKRLREREERINLLLNSTTEGIYGLDNNGHCTFCNPSCLRLLGYKNMADLLGQQMHALVHHTRADGTEYPLSECRIFQRLGKKEGAHADNELFWRADGTSFWVEYWSYPVMKDNEIVETVVTFIDISERRATEADKEKLNVQLQQAQKLEAVGTLASGIAHDFNNILSAILGYTELAQLKLPPDSDIGNDLVEVFRGVNRAKDLVKQILTFSRQAKHERRPLQIHLIVKEALKLLRASIPTTIEIREKIDPQSGTVLADATQIHQVLMNLCTNAYQAMRESGGVLAVNLSRVEIMKEDNKVAGLHLAPGSYIKLEVSDTGHGMERALMERIFEPYFTTRKKGEGTGMGLALVHGIVKDHDGHISVYSEPGKGSSFHVYLPRIETGPVDSEPVVGQALPGGTEQVLVVDDEQVIMQMMQRMLKDLGYRVTAMTSGMEALQYFRAQPDKVDLVITDMTMPHITGAQLAQKLLAVKPDLPIILCTGFSELINEKKAKAIGIREYIMKPIVIHELAGVVRKVLDER